MPGVLPIRKPQPADKVLQFESGAAEAQIFRQQMGHISRQSAVFFAGTIFTAATGYLLKFIWPGCWERKRWAFTRWG